MQSRHEILTPHPLLPISCSSLVCTMLTCVQRTMCMLVWWHFLHSSAVLPANVAAFSVKVAGVSHCVCPQQVMAAVFIRLCQVHWGCTWTSRAGADRSNKPHHVCLIRGRKSLWPWRKTPPLNPLSAFSHWRSVDSRTYVLIHVLGWTHPQPTPGTCTLVIGFSHFPECSLPAFRNLPELVALQVERALMTVTGRHWAMGLICSAQSIGSTDCGDISDCPWYDSSLCGCWTQM